MPEGAGFPCPFCGDDGVKTIDRMSVTAEDGAQLELRCRSCDYVWVDRS